MDDLPGMLSSRRLRRLQREQSRPVVGDAAVDDLLCGLYVAIREMLKLRQALASRYLALVPLATTALIFQPCPHHAAPCLIYPFRPLLCIEKRGNRFFFFVRNFFSFCEKGIHRYRNRRACDFSFLYFFSSIRIVQSIYVPYLCPGLCPHDGRIRIHKFFDLFHSCPGLRSRDGHDTGLETLYHINSGTASA